MKTEIDIFPYGEVRSSLSPSRMRTFGQRTRVSRSVDRAAPTRRSVFIAFSRDLDASFIDLFRRRATHETKLLILNEGTPTDTLLSRILEMQVRTPQRLYVLDSPFGTGKTHRAALVLGLLNRLVSGLEANEGDERILDAQVENGVLHVISPKFERLNVPIAEIPALKKEDSSKVEEFEIDEDGAFIYWPKLDVHLGWRQLQQLNDPEAALRASQKSAQFNKRYGKAVQILRERKELGRSDIFGLSEKQLGRIESGECRLTSNAIETLAKAHKLPPNDYMKALAKTLEADPLPGSSAVET